MYNTMRKKTLSFFLSLSIGASAFAQTTEPLWMRGGSISPDGKQIAFSYMGNLYTVPVQGGDAKQLTTNESYEGHPINSSIRFEPSAKTWFEAKSLFRLEKF